MQIGIGWIFFWLCTSLAFISGHLLAGRKLLWTCPPSSVPNLSLELHFNVNPKTQIFPPVSPNYNQPFSCKISGFKGIFKLLLLFKNLHRILKVVPVTQVRPNLAEPYLVDPHLVAIVSKFPVWSTVLFGRHLFGRLNYLVDTSLVDYL